MPVTYEELTQFHQFAAKKLNSGEHPLSLHELLDSWQTEKQADVRSEVALEELAAVAKETCAPNWDAYQAVAVDQAAVVLTRRVLQALPSGTAAPTVGAEPDGHLTLEWYRAPTQTLSVSVSPEGDLHYAALLGSRKAYGTERFVQSIPPVILNLIHEVCAA